MGVLMRFLVVFIFTMLFVFCATTATAQERDEPTVTYKKKTEIDFEDVNIDGALKRPHGSYLLEKRQSRFNPLIKLKENFNEEMLRSIELIR